MDKWDLSRVKVGGDIAGLIVVVGCVVVMLSGLPALRGWLALTVAGGVLAGAAIFIWHRNHPGSNKPDDSVMPH
jgi:hypothetical protein